MGRGIYAIDKDKVKRLALEQGLSINQLCEKAGVSVSVININKKHFPASIKGIADALGVSVSEIIKE